MIRLIRPLSCLAFLAVASRAQEAPVKLDNGNTIQLCGNCSSRTVRAAVTATNFSVAKGDKPEVLEVSSGSVREKAWKDWLTASWETNSAGVPIALNLQVSDSLIKVGTYDVVLLLKPNIPRLKLQVVQAAAQLDVPEKLLIERTQKFPGFCCDGPLPPLSVRESTGASRVSDIRFFPKQPMHGTSGVSGSLSKTDPNLVVGAGEPKDIGYALEGEFPRGTVTGSLKIVAPQLAQPVTLNYEVRTKLHVFWVLIAILLGLWLGYYVRTVLQSRIQLAQAQRQADEIASEVIDHLADYDGGVESEIRDALGTLKNAAKGTDPAAISTSAETLRAKWKAAVEAFEQRRKEATKLVRELEELLAIPRNLPTQVSGCLATARGSLAQANGLLGRHKADEAIVKANSAYQVLAEEIRDKGLSWQDSARGLNNILADPASGGIPAVVQGQFASVLKDAPPELDRIKQDSSKPEIPLLKQALDDLGAELRGVTEALLQFKLRGETEWGHFQATWIASTARLPHRAKLDDLKKKFSQLLSDVGAAAADPAALRLALPRRLAELQNNWETAILSQVAVSHPNINDLRKLIEDRKFTEAGTKMNAILNNIQVRWGDEAAAPSPDLWPTASMAASTSNLITLFGSPEERNAVLPGLPRVAIDQQLKSAQFLQTAIVGALMALWAFSSYTKDFDGTFNGLLTPFFATFLLDISIEGLKGQLKGKKSD